MQGKAKMNRYITIEKFIDILNEENLPQEHHVMVLAVLADIIGQSVVQLSDTDIFVDRDRRHLLCKYLLKTAAKN